MTTIALPRPGTFTDVRTEGTRGGWRVASRLARREVRRRWGRTLLVMILVGVPVFGMTVVTTMVRTARNTAANEFTREFGDADLMALGTPPAPSSGWPAGTQVLHGRIVDAMGIVGRGTARLARVTDLDLQSPVVRGAVLLREGRFPRTAGEALISPKIARAFHVGVGDTFALSEPAWTEKIVGIGVPAYDWRAGLVAVRGAELSTPRTSTVGAEPIDAVTLVRLGGDPTTTQLRSYAPLYQSSATAHDASTQRAVNWTLVAGLIALAISGVVISGAFAVGARRQLVTLGQLSANGADESLLRRMLSIQGAWCGALGTAAGIAVSIVFLRLMHGQFNEWAHRDIGAFIWSARDFAAIAITGVAAATVAAFFPARTAARVPVLSALAGRRPLGALPRSIVPVGAALFGGGVLVLALVGAASRNGGGDGLALAAVLGGALVLSGACCVSPVVVAPLAHLGGRLRRAGRVAVRSLVRNRARSAAVVMALAAINAGAVAIGTAFASGTQKVVSEAPFMPDNTIVVTRYTVDPLVFAPPPPGRALSDAKRQLAAEGSSSEASTFVPIPDSLVRTLHDILPDATWSTRRVVVGVVPAASSEDRGNFVPRDRGEVVVADPAVLRLIDLSQEDRATLDRTGTLSLAAAISGSKPPSATDRLAVTTPAGTRTIDVPFAQGALRAHAGIHTLVTPAKARELGLTITPAGLIGSNPSKFDESQRASIDAFASVANTGASPSTPAFTDVLWSGTRDTGVSEDTVRKIILAIVVVIALLVLAMSLALSAAETRDERDVLVALGATPTTMRSVAAWKAGLLSFAGALVAMPTGFIPVAFVYYAAARSDERAHLVFPWSTAVILLIAAPLIAALASATGSGIAQRVRPTKMSTFALD